MDYQYFTNTQPNYPFMGIPANNYPPGLDPETIRSIEPLDANASFLSPTGAHAHYDAFSFATGGPNGAPDSMAVPNTPHPVGSVDSGLGGDMEDSQSHAHNQALTTRSSSEEKEANLTPAQSRRKAQNRAAQRAFRERKERHVRDLEAKLSHLESSTHSLQSDNERLKLALQRAQTENEILRATTSASPSNSRPVSVSYPSPGAHLPTPSDDDIDDKYNVQVLPNGSVINSADKEHVASRRDARSGREVPASQVWDLIQSHHLVKQGLVDIADVCEKLKGAVKCDGQGPVFEEAVVWATIESSTRSGGDELI